MADKKDTPVSKRVNPMQETLGQFLGDLGMDDNTAASHVMNPGFPAVPQSGLEYGRRAEYLLPGYGIQDLDLMNREALAAYAATNQEANNKYHSDPLRWHETTGLARGEAQEAFEEDAVTFQSSDSPGQVELDEIGSAFFGADKLEGIISKDGVIPPAVDGPSDGNNVNRDLTKNLVEAIQAVIDKGNLYSPNPESSPYLDFEGASTTDDAYTKGLWTVQTGQGVLGQFDPNAPAMTLGPLRAMTMRMMLEASGEYGIDDLIGLDYSALGQFAAILGVSNVATLNITNVFQIGLIDLLKPSNLGPRDVAIEDEDDYSGDFKKAIQRLAKSNGSTGFFAVHGLNDSDFTVSGLSDFGSDTPVANLNSFVERFSGYFPLGMFTTCLLSLVAMAILTALIDVFVAQGKPSSGDSFTTRFNVKNPRGMAMGYHRSDGDQSEPNSLQAFLDVLGMPQVTSSTSFVNALYTGMTRFYGFDYDIRQAANPLLLPQLLDKAVNVALSPGYYAVMQRVILRDISATLMNMADAVLAAASSGAALGLLALGGGTAAFDALFVHTGFEVLAGSTAFNFLKICVGLGDIAYKAEWERGLAATGRKIPSYEEEPSVYTKMVPHWRLEANRFYGEPKSAATSPMSLLLQNSLLMSYQGSIGPSAPTYGKPRKEADLANETAADPDKGTLATTVLATNPGRLSVDVVRKYERVIDKEFTPFYIHDLRSGEIIAMPAFITSVGETYSPEYSETHGYGRTDPVRSYAKTTRSIDMSFKLCAMNEYDMQYMWFVINKLVSMCYPQRSIGRTRTFAKGTARFIQPFSQVPTASPVVRLRLGELFHSNYSVTGLSRLFGNPNQIDLDVKEPGDVEFWKKLATQNVSEKVAMQLIVADMEKAFYAAEGDALESLYYCSAAYIVLPTGGQTGGGGIPGMIPNPFAQDSTERAYVAVDFEGAEGDLCFELVTPLGLEGTSPAAAVNKKSTPNKEVPTDPPAKFYKVKLRFQSKKEAYKTLANSPILKGLDDYKSIDAYLKVDSVKKILVTLGEGAITAQDIIDKRKEMGDATGVDIADKTQAALEEQGFFSAKNAIIRSFHSAAGRGLAGVITNMSMNYDGATWGVSQTERDRAPMMVEITIGFAPIHDLPLGMDAYGEMIAPAYPVGKELNADPFDININKPKTPQEEKAADEEAAGTGVGDAKGPESPPAAAGIAVPGLPF